MPLSPRPSWKRTMSRIAASSILRNSARDRLPFLFCSLASRSALGRRKLPTWSARNGGFRRVVMVDRLLNPFETLYAFSGIDVSGKDVAVRIDGHGMHPVEFTGVAPLAPERPDLLASFAQQNMDFVIGTVTDEQVFLSRIRREANIPDGAHKTRIRFEPEFRNETAVLAEYLVTVVDSIADIHEPVVRNAHAMHRITELIRQRCTRVVLAGICVIGLGTIGAPMAPVFAGARVEHHDALVAITVRDINLVGRIIHDRQCGAAQIARAVAAFSMARFADLLHEFSFARELQHLGVVFLIVAGEPDVVAGIDKDPMLTARPIVPCAFA